MVFPALDFWDLVIEVLHSSLNQPRARRKLCCNEQSGKRSNARTKEHPNRDDLRLTNVDHVTSDAKLSHFGALLHVFEENEAVITMIIKGRSPTMRRVSSTHRVALELVI